jgi:ribosomal protein S18 acetylase RimI-like enzyme
MHVSSPITIRPVLTRKDIAGFVDVPFRINGSNRFWVPPLISQERAMFDPSRNPAFDDCSARLFIASRGGRDVGRIAAIVSRPYVQKRGPCGRFGWFDCEDDGETALSLFREAESWLVSEGMEEVSGPLGFCDLDTTGLLVEGFDELPPIAGSYNPPYYAGLVEAAGYTKEIDYVEYRITVPGSLPDRLTRLVSQIRERTGIRVFNETDKKVLARRWGSQVFDVINEAYEELYGTTTLSARQIAFYIDAYLGHVDPEFIKLAAEGDRLIGFVIAMPSLSEAFQKARGRLFPLGFAHVLRAMKTSRVLDFYLAGIRPEYRNRGIDVMLSYEMGVTALRRGMLFAESNHELESNSKIQSMWKLYERRLHRRTRVYNRRLS